MSALLIGIAGGTASGKTTLARILKNSFQDKVTILKHDYYYHDRSHFKVPDHKINFDHPDSFETELLIEQLQELKQGRAVERPVYSYKTNERLENKKKVESAPIVIVEGILIFHYEDLKNLFDLKIYVDTDADIRLLRRISRDIKERDRTFESVKNQYLKTVKPMHQKFVEPSKYQADIIIPHGGLNEIANDLIIKKIKDHLRQI
ncbi:uridine kinase [Halanaerobium saccharolyticum]|uniref:Uridine kinase n=1 Tax=Halanaerobium saccharolyticum TaxID=43595 RepID=A0A4V3G5J6_9FIRM|nr:uridine kinase [Halanaerobium saccharolyticum]RAK10325.1 uridine kinase [Halanaerobium saccharolyticum]TDW05271.1 uridine kinase [Halanaerobium saccharolyticum]TDX60341.1 uridine kinase [Halanaerobium saccharolyticum]